LVEDGCLVDIRVDICEVGRVVCLQPIIIISSSSTL
jgi:hypothetical protein